LDQFSRKVIGRSLDRTLAARIAVAALEQAITQRQPPPGVVVHNDQGVQFASAEFQQVIQNHRMMPSIAQYEPAGKSL
jgi:putative transposase